MLCITTIPLFILELKTSNNLQQFKYINNDIKQYFTEMLKKLKENKPKI